MYKNLHAIVLSVFLVGCSKYPSGITVIPEVEAHDSEGQQVEWIRPITGELIPQNSPEVTNALALYQRSGNAPIIKKSGFMQYPFGESEPVLTCRLFRTCSIELQPGEQLRGAVVGDPVAWDVGKMISERDGLPIYHIIVKPRRNGLASNLIVTTNRRTYFIGLVSKQDGYVRQLKFYYPHDDFGAYQGRDSVAVTETNGPFEIVAKPEIDNLRSKNKLAHEELNFEYDIEGEDVSWKPERVYDDGKRVYIQWSKEMPVEEHPGLFLEKGQGSKRRLLQTNWRVDSDRRVVIVDGLFKRAHLIAGVGGQQQRVTIARR